jgi:hypothetical protein
MALCSRRLLDILLFCSVLLSGAGVSGQSPQKVDTAAIGPRVGQPVPDFSGTDQRGRQHTLASSLGAKGAMLVFFRSADW